MQNVPGGEYYHFGITKSVSTVLRHLFSPKQMPTQIKMQVNIDGIPLYKSSKQQFWPILGKLVEPERSSPFIIGIFCGNSKPIDITKYISGSVCYTNETNRIEWLPCGRH